MLIADLEIAMPVALGATGPGNATFKRRMKVANSSSIAGPHRPAPPNGLAVQRTAATGR
jgi:hypothetical protein